MSNGPHLRGPGTVGEYTELRLRRALTELNNAITAYLGENYWDNYEEAARLTRARQDADELLRTT